MNCSICGRETPDKYLEKHHLIPKSKKGKETITVCVDCGNSIHQFFSNSELKKRLNTINKIKSDPKMQTWINWISKKPNSFGVCMARKK